MIINGNNIEAVLYDYAEGNLSGKEGKEVEKYLNLHPEYKEMLGLYDPHLTVEEPSDIVYESKEELFNAVTGHNAKKIILISRYVKWISGAAAMIVLLLAVKGVYNLSYQGVNDNKVIADTNNLTDFKNQTADVYTDITNGVNEMQNNAKQCNETFENLVKREEKTDVATASNAGITATEDNKTDRTDKTNVYSEQIPANTDIAMQNSVTYIQEVDDLPDNMDTIKIIYVKSGQPKHNNPLINYVNRKTGGMIDKAKERIAYKF